MSKNDERKEEEKKENIQAKYKEEVSKLEFPASQSLPRLVIAGNGNFEDHEMDENEALTHLSKTEAYLSQVSLIKDKLRHEVN